MKIVYKTLPDPSNRGNDDRIITIISPFEEIGMNSSSYHNEAIPSAEGELLLEFIKKHIFERR